MPYRRGGMRFAVSRCLISLATVAGAVLVRLPFSPILGRHIPLVTFPLAVLVAGYFGGLSAGLLTTFFGILAAHFLIMQPTPVAEWPKPDDLIGLGLFLVVGVCTSLICEALRRARREAEQNAAALYRSEERFRVTYEQAAVGIEQVTLEGRLLDFNAEFCRILGYSREELLGRTFAEITHPEDLAQEEVLIARLLTGEITCFRLDKRYLRKDGSPVWARLNSSLAKAAESYRISVVEDISELKQAERVLAEQSRILESFYKHTSTCIVFLDRHLNFIRVNEAYARVCGRDASEFIGRNHFELYPSEELQGKFERVVATKQPYQIYSRPFSFPDHPEWGVSYWDLGVFPLLDYTGDVDILVFTLIDVTERVRAEEKMRQQAALLELAHDAIFVRDMADQIVFWSRGAQRLYGWSKEEALGRMAHELLQSRFPKPLQEIRQEMLGQEQWEGQLIHVSRDGRKIIVDSRWAMQRDIAGQVVAVLEINRDITERQQAEDALRQAHDELEHRVQERTLELAKTNEVLRTEINEREQVQEQLRRQAETLRAANERLAEADRRKDEFLAMLAHELRNPLAPVRNAVQVMNLTCNHNCMVHERMVHYREIVERQIGHMARLIDDLLDVSRITHGRIELRKQPLSLAEVFGHAVEMIRPQIEKRRHTLHLVPPPDSLRLEADPDRLIQAIGNLLVNAAKYTDEGGQIWLESQAENGMVVIRVRDSGMGIAPEVLPHIFDLFAQADRTLSHSSGGLGLGLTLVQKIVHLHDGTVEARSEGLGRGSEFIIRLPAKSGGTNGHGK